MKPPRILTAAIVSLTALGAAATTSHAALTTFLGEDIGINDSTRLLVHPNSDAARASFLSNLSGVGTENFESFADGTALPLALTFTGSVGNITATLSGAGSILDLPGAGTSGAGRYPISGTKFINGVQSTTGSAALTLQFSTEIAAFGFYATDLGDFNGTVELRLSGAVVNVVSVGNAINTNTAGTLFFGVIDTTNTFDEVVFLNSGAGGDIFGIDDLTIGDLQQVIPPQPPTTAVPEPGSALVGMLVLGLCGLGGARRRRSAAVAQD